MITTVLGGQHPEHILGIHSTLAQAPPGMTTDGLSPLERSWAEETRSFWLHCSAYAKQQATRPQTIGYALVDSPVGLLAWILDKFAEGADTADSPFETIPPRPHPRRRHPLLVDTNRCLGCPHLLRESWRGN